VDIYAIRYVLVHYEEHNLWMNLWITCFLSTDEKSYPLQSTGCQGEIHRLLILVVYLSF
jgi:hypothetical protein